MKIEESERLAALLTAHMMEREDSKHHDNAGVWRDTYRKVLAEFMEHERQDAEREQLKRYMEASDAERQAKEAEQG